MQQKISFITGLILFPLFLYSQLQTPDEFLPHKLGETFTPHYMLVDYMEHVAANSQNVLLKSYGMTNQKRPLLLATVSSPENLARIEDIRKNNLIKTGLLEGMPDPNLDVAIVWLSFSVHGNEAAGSESSMAIMYDLVDPNNTSTQEWLKNTVVLVDPALNPDGYSRYTHWYRNIANKTPDSGPSTREHREPWPGGRVNHYLFDLNRDWAWQTQVESQQRMKVYHDWMPHIHADLHEQFHNNPYYFAPAARPYHDYITDWQTDFQIEIGKNHAKYFDAKGWLYFTKEVFDLLYPSYGDTYPTFHGSIGMTYEQGGHSRAGRAIQITNGDTLTLADRIAHHKTTALSTVEIGSKNVKRIVAQFEDYFDKSQNAPPGEYKTFVVKGSNSTSRLKAFCAMLDKNKIQYGKIDKGSTLKEAYNYQTGENTSLKVEANDLVISAHQPLGLFTQVLLEPKPGLEDSLTYDITAWSLPYAYGLETYASKQKVKVNTGYDFGTYSNNLGQNKTAYAYLATWNSLSNAQFLGALLKSGVKVRYANGNFDLEGKKYAPGTLIMTRADNRKVANFDQIVATTAQEFQQEITAVQTGFVDSGKDLGSGSLTFIEAPKIAILSGEKTSSLSFGQVWYFFEQNLNYPISIFDADNLSSINLEDYNLLVMPEGRYSLNDNALDKLNSWISGGGRLIAIGSAVGSLEDKKGFNLTKFADDADKSGAEKARKQAALDHRLDDFAGQERRSIAHFIPGAIFKLDIDNTHPLGYGLPDYYFTLKTGSRSYQHLKNSWNVGSFGAELMVSGFAGSQAQEGLKNTTVFAVQEKGRGSVTYMVDNPLFRAFWENGKFLFSNAVFLVGQ